MHVELADTPALKSFAEDIRSWLAANLTDELRMPLLADPTAADDTEYGVRLEWQRRLHAGGWAAVHWPREHGGRSASLIEHAIFLQECAQAGAPEPVNAIGLLMAGPTIIAFGSPEQRRLLPRILSADDMWCQLFSEPEAGSDLGNISTRAVRTADGWRVTGQKLWTSWGMRADRGLLLARTSDQPGGRGLSCFLLDLHAPGVTVRPVRQLSGESHFSEVQLRDVPVAATALLGQEGGGWAVAMSTLTSERTTGVFARHAHLVHAAKELVGLAAQRRADPAAVDRAARLWSQSQLMRLAAYDGAWSVADAPTAPAPTSLLLQRLCWGLTARAVMEEGQRLSAWRADRDADERQWNRLLLISRGWTIAGGTSEIQRNMLAERVLGLPRQSRPAPRDKAAAARGGDDR